MTNELRVLTLNCWGLPQPLSKAKAVRMRAISARLAQSDYDIIGLQELWVSSVDYEAFKKALASRFPYSKFFYGGAFGMGLAIFSRFPIVDTQSSSYTYNGLPIAVAHGDWIVGKGVGCATIDVPGLEHGLDVWVTHTVAAGGEDGPEATRSPRITQTYELARWARASSERRRHVIALGDFNCTPPSLSVSLLREVGLLTDAFLDTHPNLPANAVSLSGDGPSDPQQCIEELGITCDSPLNTWTAGKKLDARAQKGCGKRLDYIYYAGPLSSSGLFDRVVSKGKLRAKSCEVCFTEPVPGHGVSYTDHFGVEATFVIEEQAQPSQLRSAAKAVETLQSSMQALAAGQRLAVKQQQTQLLGFGALLLFAIGLIVGSAFQPIRGVSAIFTFLAVAAGWAATTLLYSGVIWGEWERRIYQTMLESMRLELKRVENTTAAGPQAAESLI